MPNWTQNTIRADGPEAALRAFMDAIKGLEDPIDFERIIPMPPILRNTCSGFREFDGRQVETWFQSKHPAFDGSDADDARPFTPEEEAMLKDLGHTSWYSWSIQHWGTKWNACHGEITEQQPGFVEIRFDTAWSMPQPVAEKVFEMFPDLEICWTWSDEHDGYTMRYSMERDAVQSQDEDVA